VPRRGIAGNFSPWLRKVKKGKDLQKRISAGTLAPPSSFCEFFKQVVPSSNRMAEVAARVRGYKTIPVSPRRFCLLVLLALFYAGLNLFKPPHIDDAAYVYFARQFAQHPLDPYGFWLQWYYEPQPALEILAPPVLPAHCAVGIAWFGERPWLWKVVLLPWSLLLVVALDALLRRFTGGLETPLLVMLVLSPAFLPSLNLMLDVPVLALSLAAIECFLRACERESFPQAALAGLLAGLAAQVKYTAFLAPVVMLAAAVCRGRLRLWPAAALLAAQVFVSWELLMALMYRESHFLHHSHSGGPSLQRELQLLRGLFGNAGGLMPAVTLLGLVALQVEKRWLLRSAAGVLVGYAAVLSHWQFDEPRSDFNTVELVFDLFDLAGLVILGLVLDRLLRGAASDKATPSERQMTIFLTLWLLLEVTGYFLLSPFPAVRRMLGMVVVVTLLFGRLAARTCVTPQRRRGVWAVAAGGVVLGLLFWGLDFREAWAQQEAVERAAAWIRSRQPESNPGRIWYTGHWGFQFAAEQAGMRAVINDFDPPDPGYIQLPPPSLLRRGDWLVVPDEEIDQQETDRSGSPLRPEICIQLCDPIPLRTVRSFYLGFIPVRYSRRPRRAVTIYRVLEDFTPPNPETYSADP
jgi:hypothetical protein